MDNNNKTQVPIKLLINPIHLLSLGFGSGLSPKMPGTTGSLAALGLFLLLPQMDWKIHLAVLIGASILGIYICSKTASALNTHDHPAIVWDEFVGIFITFFLVPKQWVWILLGFVLFRLFDIFKPWPISIADKRVKGGLGIMLDDIIAGFFSLIIIQIILYLL